MAVTNTSTGHDGLQDEANHVYTPLQPGSMRVLWLHAGNETDPLVGTFEHRPMKGRSVGERYERCDTLQRDNLLPEALCTDHGYDAISYVWGAPRFPHKLYIQGNGRINITVSLFQALRRFRSSDKPRRLWADAVCINQTDSAEKATQVAAMHTIYTDADNVLVWLGPEDAQDALAFPLMYFCDIKRTSDLNLDDDQILDHLNEKLQSASCCPCCGQVLDKGESNPAMAAIMAMTKLIERLWFFRVWVVQEMDHRLTVGRFFSGSHSVPIVDFITALYLLLRLIRDNRLPLTKEESRAIKDNIAQIGHEYGGKRATTRSFWNSFASFSRRQCSDPRDRVYAIRSCLELEGLDGLVPDYQVTAGETFRRLTCSMMLESNFPDVGANGEEADRSRAPWIPLSLVGTETRHQNSPWKAPSWVPDLHRLSDRSRGKLVSMTQAFSDDHELYQSNPARFECKVDLKNTEQLHLRGHCFAVLDTPAVRTAWPTLEVEDLETASGDQVVIDDILSWYRACEEEVRPVLAHYPEDHAIRLFRDLLLCKPRRNKPEDNEISSPCETEGVLHGLADERYVVSKNFLRQYLEKPSLEINSTNLDPGRILATVRDGDYTDAAWVPSTSQAGDCICLIGGAPFAYVLRPCDDGTFKLLGDAFTATGSLAEALGGRRASFATSSTSNMSWRTDDEEMVALMDRLGWLTLS